ncbi:hypothetical protein [Sphingomonas sp. J315]|uniref:hypothetical protein n=1 Tax=Sphingomonas sp. J315 TaxID=2898433 RepID=UPI0021AE0051|nr:hypothetical protein [Sphingomonas sp. J315]UUY00596.1 hypothetical protein LRS08_05805 [Sphingomonas sp. J315]
MRGGSLSFASIGSGGGAFASRCESPEWQKSAMKVTLPPLDRIASIAAPISSSRIAFSTLV